ncbi:ATP-binding cassette domain-containing protein [Alloscardovia criceti]|uniref:ATP-binding cassette domain-containing protein n=1 Tax=Alloscardovia criceti TaxID=356828 RepID=UPI00036F3897|nr:ABC transporter ATP-binding protein [Alloscardovia criceti]
MTVEVKDLNIFVGKKQLLTNVNLTVEPGQRVGLIGASGSGKSLIIKAILGILPSTMHMTGQILVGDVDIAQLPDAERAQLRGTYMSAVFQNPLAALNPVLTVAKNVELPLKLHYDLSTEARQQRVDDALRHVELEAELKKRFPSELSGGQAQRVSIAEALISHPQLLVADEPTTALDSLVQQQIVDMLVERTQVQRAALIFASHDFSVISRAAQSCYVIHHGEVVESGDISNLIQHPQHEYTVQLVQAAREIAVDTSSQAEVK